MALGPERAPHATTSLGASVTPRLAVAWVVTLALGALAGPILGEYEFKGLFPAIAGLLTGLLLGEACVGLGKRRHVVSGVVTVVAAVGGLLFAGWRASSEGLDPYPAAAWLAAALGAVTAWLRAGPWVRRRS
jgi:predicted branched-subunit amino acid permease